jgi:hypothetical protein
MATLILSTVGSVIGGPVGQVIGAIAGSVIDRAVIGGRKIKRDGPRLADLTVQTASFGEPIPLVYGTCRIAGNVIWSSGLIERQSTERTGSRKSGTTTTTTYSYFASFAVALTGREILRVERIWADGKLIRANATGALSVGGQVRIYTGAEDQKSDSLLEAALTANYTPHNRGMAYAVVEELALVEFANRIPNLTFEIVADEPADCTQGAVIADLALRSGVRGVTATALTAPCDAVLVADASAVRGTLEALAVLTPVRVAPSQNGLMFQPLNAQAPATIGLEEQAASHDGNRNPGTLTRKRADATDLPGEIEIRHIDATRDYQAGVQRAKRRDTGARRQLDLPIVMNGSRAKQIAEIVLARQWRERDHLALRVPLSRLDILPGDVVHVAGVANDWRVDSRIMEDGGLTLSLVALRSADALSSAVGDGGVAIGQTIQPHGPTVAHVLDLPPLEGALATTGRLILAANGASAGWRMASVWHSTDGGSNYVQAATVSAPTVIGIAESVLAAGSALVWDLHHMVDVALLNARSDVLARTAADVLAGANMALLGNELLQFTTVQILSGSRVRLGGLLRGRRGTERFMGSHGAGERFVLLDPLPTGRDEMPLAQIGQSVTFKALSPQESLGDVGAQTLVFAAQALRPLSPAGLTAAIQANGDTLCSWIRRSRAGFDWIDGVDAPLAEDSEQYQITVLANGVAVRQITAAVSFYVYAAADRAADAAFGALAIRVSQVSAQVGSGAATEIQL